ncbi:hypothetical protein BC828DRAFT_373182 [Blastocladiella britannica]|nr:hypothetical protein BC828DRAFT_373182 [Blastocladiella britannica]
MEFQTLRGNELVNAIYSTFRHQFSEDDLTRSSGATHFFQVVLADLVGLSPETLQERCIDSMRNFQTQLPHEYYLDKVREFGLAKAVAKLLTEIGLPLDPGFSVRDLQQPEIARMRLIASYLVYFRAYTAITITVREECEAGTLLLERQRTEMREKIVEAERRRDEARAKHEASLAQAKHQRDTNHKYSREVANKRKELEEGRARLDLTLKRAALLRAANQKREFEIKIAKEELERQRQWVISDPQQAREALQTLKNRSRESLQRVEDYQQSLNSQEAHAKAYMLFVADINGMLEIMKECIELQQKVQGATHDAAQKDSAVHSKEEHNEDLRNAIEALESRIEGLKGVLEGTEAATSASLQEAERQRLTAAGKCAQARKKRAEAEAHIERCKQQIDLIVAETQEVVRSGDEAMSTLAHSVDLVIASARAYFNDITRGLQESEGSLFSALPSAPAAEDDGIDIAE